MAEAAQFQEAGPAPARRWLRRSAAALAGVPLLAGLVQVTPAAPAQATEQAAAAKGVDVSIDSMTPATPDEGDTITVSGSVTNDGPKPVDDARVALRLGQSIQSRSGIDAASRSTPFSYSDGKEVGGKRGSVKFKRLAAGQTRDFKLSVPAEDLDLDRGGVYRMGVTLSGATPGRPGGQVLGVERTLLPWQPEAAKKKTGLSYLWPLISSSHLTAQTDSDDRQTPVFRDESLASELKPGGRLQQLVSLGKDRPVTWVIDPDLLASVTAMTENYKIEGPKGRTRPGKNQAVAKEWLKDLQNAVEGEEVVALPFADPDLASLAHRGKNVSGALGHLRPATDLASRTVGNVLGVKPRTDFAWPVEGAVDTSVVDVATSAGAHNVIARSDSMREATNLPYTPSAARPIGSGNTAVVSDARLSTMFRGGMMRAEDSTLAVQRFLAQTLMITMENPGKQRNIVVAPQRLPSSSEAQTMARAIDGIEEGRWTQPLPLSDAAKAKPDPRATTHVPGPGTYPRSLRREELPKSAFETIQRTQSALEGFQVVLSQPERVVTPFGNAMMREMSASWRGRTREAEAFRGSVEDYLSGLSRGVQLIQKSTQTLSGRSATIPVTVQNNLVQGVEGLKLVLKSSQPNRLDVGDPQPVRIEGGHSQSVKFDTTANANGPVRVHAQLYTEDGTPYGAPMTFKVTATSITSTVILVIAGGVLLLVLAGVRMYSQRKRAVAEGGTDAAPDEPESAGVASGTEGGTEDRAERKAEGEDPEQEGDASPDTGPDGDGPSGTGEKVNR
ncbi:DUF6049 family protein [Streptomyces meridianus]|uniref:DUF6049 family protein n=1 Tax=Streptomyces meridianus TaxID=2938945 RepID=A0ABT0X7J0_9ACTN|nr:DUF6049 family protein [Streptomyces meridianus]MCM2578498.1 DUF6049 family protein [Streptomyces meridianus]